MEDNSLPHKPPVTEEEMPLSLSSSQFKHIAQVRKKENSAVLSQDELKRHGQKSEIDTKQKTHNLARWLTLAIIASFCLLLLISVLVGLFSSRETSDISGQLLQILQPALFTLLGFLFGKHYVDKSS